MSAPKINAEMAITMVGVLPSLHPRPNGMGLNQLERSFIDKLSTTPLYQLTDKRYGWMMEDIQFYALPCPTLWVTRQDPGPLRRINPVNNTAGQADELVQYNFKYEVCESQKNVKSATIAGLNLTIPDAYTRVSGGGVGTLTYRTTDNPSISQGIGLPLRKIESDGYSSHI